jgi:hypothetical protein
MKPDYFREVEEPIEIEFDSRHRITGEYRRLNAAGMPPRTGDWLSNPTWRRRPDVTVLMGLDGITFLGDAVSEPPTGEHSVDSDVGKRVSY